MTNFQNPPEFTMPSRFVNFHDETQRHGNKHDEWLFRYYLLYQRKFRNLTSDYTESCRQVLQLTMHPLTHTDTQQFSHQPISTLHTPPLWFVMGGYG